MIDQSNRAEPSIEYEAVFAQLESGANVTVAMQAAEIQDTTRAILELEEITRQVDMPYIGTYLSV